jgi:hypothetical protein
MKTVYRGPSNIGYLAPILKALRVQEEEMSAMNNKRFHRFIVLGLFGLMLASSLGLAGQAKPSNLFKAVADNKGKIVWKNAPANTIPADVCAILAACAGAPDKVIALPPATEAGKRVTRGLFLSRSNDAKKTDMVIELRQTATEAYFFALAPDGSMQKTAYAETGKGWTQIGNSLAKPIFDKETQVWSDHVAKLGAASSVEPAEPAKS